MSTDHTLDPSLPQIDAAGERRVLGHVPPPPGTLVSSVARIKVLPESQWQEFDLRDDPTFRPAVPILDQNGKGACNGHAAVSSLHVARWLAGQTPVALSPWYVYAILCNGFDRGSDIGEALKLLSERGAPRFDLVPYGVINPRVLSAKSHEDAGRFKIEIGAPAKSFAELMTLTQLHIPFNFSIRVGGNFNNLDAEGCPPVSLGPGNHAIMGGFAAKKMRNGRWKIGFDNSWTTAWGLDGSAWFHEGHILRQSYFEAYGVQAPTDDPSDANNPPAAV